MSVETVRAFLALHAPDVEVVELGASTATVEMAAAGHGVAPAQIAKTLSLRIKDRALLIVAAGDARLNNRKIKDVLGGKPRMLGADEVVPAAGSTNSALRISPARLASLVGAQWVDVCDRAEGS